MINSLPHIVIIGAGFGGAYSAKYLVKLANQGKIKLTLINPDNYFLFTPLLPEVATGGLLPHNVIEFLPQLFAGSQLNLIYDRVQSIDLEGQQIKLSQRFINYDYLIVATGAEINYWRLSTARDFTHPFKNLTDALKIKQRLIELVNQADNYSPAKEIIVSVIGAGPTGIELIAEISQLVRQLNKYQLPATPVRLKLYGSRSEILPTWPQKLQTAANRRLAKLGVELCLGEAVKDIQPAEIILASGQRERADLIIWTAGVMVSAPEFKQSLEINSAQQILVNQYLQLEKYPQVYIIGDLASLANEENAWPQLAQVATKQAKAATNNIKAQLADQAPKSFKWQSAGQLVSIGQGFALMDAKGIKLTGVFAWWLWRTIYLFKFISVRKRFRIAFDWTLNLFSPRDFSNWKL